jgi:hypothetical protein
MRPRDSERSDVDRTSCGIRCEACGDVIGVYEPLVHLVEGLAWHTSRAAEPNLEVAAGRRYHLACYEALADQANPGQAGAP